ncbi:unnamed protein product [Amoebophrya sp. A120]|nr:unnamed protein product [Amoebophrya sp. A120]|eukprot:GSA120T00013221001.1
MATKTAAALLCAYLVLFDGPIGFLFVSAVARHFLEPTRERGSTTSDENTAAGNERILTAVTIGADSETEPAPAQSTTFVDHEEATPAAKGEIDAAVDTTASSAASETAPPGEVVVARETAPAAGDGATGTLFLEREAAAVDRRGEQSSREFAEDPRFGSIAHGKALVEKAMDKQNGKWVSRFDVNPVLDEYRVAFRLVLQKNALKQDACPIQMTSAEIQSSDPATSSEAQVEHATRSAPEASSPHDSCAEEVLQWVRGRFLVEDDNAVGVHENPFLTLHSHLLVDLNGSETSSNLRTVCQGEITKLKKAATESGPSWWANFKARTHFRLFPVYATKRYVVLPLLKKALHRCEEFASEELARSKAADERTGAEKRFSTEGPPAGAPGPARAPGEAGAGRGVASGPAVELRQGATAAAASRIEPAAPAAAASRIEFAAPGAAASPIAPAAAADRPAVKGAPAGASPAHSGPARPSGVGVSEPSRPGSASPAPGGHQRANPSDPGAAPPGAAGAAAAAPPVAPIAPFWQEQEDLPNPQPGVDEQGATPSDKGVREPNQRGKWMGYDVNDAMDPGQDRGSGFVFAARFKDDLETGAKGVALAYPRQDGVEKGKVKVLIVPFKPGGEESPVRIEMVSADDLVLSLALPQLGYGRGSKATLENALLGPDSMVRGVSVKFSDHGQDAKEIFFSAAACARSFGWTAGFYVQQPDAGGAAPATEKPKFAAADVVLRDPATSTDLEVHVLEAVGWPYGRGGDGLDYALNKLPLPLTIGDADGLDTKPRTTLFAQNAFFYILQQTEDASMVNMQLRSFRRMCPGNFEKEVCQGDQSKAKHEKHKGSSCSAGWSGIPDFGQFSVMTHWRDRFLTGLIINPDMVHAAYAMRDHVHSASLLEWGCESREMTKTTSIQEQTQQGTYYGRKNHYGHLKGSTKIEADYSKYDLLKDEWRGPLKTKEIGSLDRFARSSADEQAKTTNEAIVCQRSEADNPVEGLLLLLPKPDQQLVGGTSAPFAKPNEAMKFRDFLEKYKHLRLFLRGPDNEPFNMRVFDNAEGKKLLNKLATEDEQAKITWEALVGGKVGGNQGKRSQSRCAFRVFYFLPRHWYLNFVCHQDMHLLCLCV